MYVSNEYYRKQGHGVKRISFTGYRFRVLKMPSSCTEESPEETTAISFNNIQCNQQKMVSQTGPLIGDQLMEDLETLILLYLSPSWWLSDQKLGLKRT